MLDLKFSEILRQNAQMMLSTTGEEYRVRLLGNITLNPLKELLDYALLSEGVKPMVTVGNYDNIVQDSMQCQGENMVVIFYDAFKFAYGLPVFFEDISEQLYLQLFERICAEINMTFDNLRECPSVVFNNFSSACFASGATHQSLLDKLIVDMNHFLNTQRRRNVTVLDINKVFQRATVCASVDMRMFYSSRAPYTVTFFKHYAMSLLPVVMRNCGKWKKAIIFDCDNTLWKGILGEDGPEGIEMTPATHAGEVFHAIQQIAVYLSNQGVLIGICSKNNEDDVLPVFNQGVLRNEHIVIFKINWTDKATNLREIASELNIGTDSLVFVDDSDFEVNLIREQLPEVTTLQVPKNLFDYPKFLLDNCYRYFNLTPNEEDKQKTRLYKSQVKRNMARSNAQSLEQYLESMHIVLHIHIDNANHIERIAQLTQKTNQFNLTTHRYTETQIEQFINADRSFVMSVAVSDDFGDNGLTALAIVILEGDTAQIDTLLMSCRIIGRNIEYVLFDQIMAELSQRGIREVQAAYKNTAKNAQVADFYKKAGLLEIFSDATNKRYELDVEQYTPSKIDYIQIK